MKTVAILLVLSLASVAVLADGPRKDTFWELADKLVPPSMQKLLNSISIFTADKKDTDGAKEARKISTEVRDYLDIFSYAYPNTTENILGQDVWSVARLTLNQAHKVIGEFKDLDDSGASYSQELFEKRLKRVIQWKDAFTHLYPTLMSVLKTDSSQFFYRPKEQMSSQFFWGSVNYEPSPSRPAFDNFALLVNALLASARSNYTTVIETDVQRILQDDKVDEVHAFRKQLRQFVSVDGYFPEIWQVEKRDQAKDLIATVQTIYSHFGKVMDKAAAYTAYQKDGKHGKAKEAQREFVQMWKELVGEMVETQLPEKLDGLKNCLVVTA